MKKIITLFILNIPFLLFAQTAVEYTYDPAGNRIQRGLAMLAPPPNEDNARQVEEGEVAEAVTSQNKSNAIDGNVKINPNPTEGQVVVILKQPIESATVKLYDISGKELIIAPLQGMQHSMDLTAYPAGQYILLIQGKGYWQEWKIIKL